MIEVRLKRARHGCVLGLLNMLTLGIFNMLSRAAERRQIVHMDASGFTTLGGKKCRWDEIRRVHRTVRTVMGAKAYETIDVYLNRGFVTLPTGDAENADEVLDYFLRHAPRRSDTGPA